LTSRLASSKLRRGFNVSNYTTGSKAVLTIIFAWVLMAGCGLSPDPEEAPPKLEAQELFLVEQYLRVVEVRGLAVEGLAEADSVLGALALEIPVDSVMDISARISSENPERWQIIFQEIQRRIDLMEP
jgi:hypothetical protein